MTDKWIKGANGLWHSYCPVIARLQRLLVQRIEREAAKEARRVAREAKRAEKLQEAA